MMALTYTDRDGRIAEIQAIGDPDRLREMELALLD